MFTNSKRLLAMLAILIALPVAANAQTARVEGMALQGDYIKDYTAIYGWPSSITGVGNLVYGEFGNTDFPRGNYDRAVGAVLGNLFDGRFGTWGIHLRETTPQMTQGDQSSNPAPGQAGFDPNTHANESFDLMWGSKVGGMNLGLRLNRSFMKDEITEPGITSNLEFDQGFFDDNLSRNIWGFGGGVGFELSPQATLEVSLLYQNRTFANENNTGVVATSTLDENDGGTAYNLGARMMWQSSSNLLVVPVFRYYNYDLSHKSNIGGTITNFDNSLKGWQLGAAGNWTLGSNDLFVLGATLANNTIDAQEDLFGLTGGGGPFPGFSGDAKLTESIYPQIFAALETHVNSWLTIRFGANKGVFQTLKYEEKGTAGTGSGTAGAFRTETVSFSPFSMQLGAGVKLGTLQFDALVADDFYQNLGWVGSGNARSGGYFPKVTATYSF